MKLLKSLSVLILFLSIIIVNIGTSYASEQYTYEDYLRDKNDGYIAEDVTFEDLIGPDDMTFENMIEFTESNPNFTKIYESDNMDLESEDFRAVVTTLYPGDFFVMDSNASAGFSGHAVLVLSNNEFLNHTPKLPGGHPQTITREKFNRDYKGRNIKVYRSNNYYWGVNASNWADRTYRNSNATYQITNSLSDTSKTYCSKIVYQAYRYGAGKESINEMLFDIVRPYDLPKWIKAGHHGEYNTYE